EPGGHARLRSERHHRCAGRRRPRRAEPPDPCDARRIHDRFRQRLPRRSAADEPEPVPADVPLRRGDPRPARETAGPLRLQPDGRAGMSRLLPLQEIVAPAGLVIVAALLGTTVSQSTQTYFTDTLVKVAIVVALYVFIGNSGVLSFGHISFVALGAWTA